MVTAKEFAHEWFKETLDPELNKARVRGEVLVEKYLIEFAKMHVEAALKAADREVPLYLAEQVRNSYPNTNIK